MRRSADLQNWLGFGARRNRRRHRHRRPQEPGRCQGPHCDRRGDRQAGTGSDHRVVVRQEGRVVRTSLQLLLRRPFALPDIRQSRYRLLRTRSSAGAREERYGCTHPLPSWLMKSLRREPDQPDETCWLAGEGWWAVDGWHLTSCNPATQITAHLRRGPERTGGPGREAT